MSFRIALVGLLTQLGCGDPTTREPAIQLPIESAIATDLGARFGTSVAVHCLAITVVPLKCTAKLADGTELPIAIEHARHEWGWRVDGVVIEAAPIVTYVEQELAGIHVTQTVDCGRRVQVLRAHDRMVCKLGGGGAAFVTFAADGTASLELALDAAAAAARMELTSADRDRDLAKQSQDLESLAGESDGEEEVTLDAGAP